MTSVTIHDGMLPEVTAAPGAPQTPQPTIAPIAVDFDRKPTAVDYPIGDQRHEPMSQPRPAPFSGTMGHSVMPPVMAETPTQIAVNGANKHIRCQDSLGRIIGIKKLGAGERMKIMRILGGTLSENMSYFGHAMLAACVREFNGEAVPPPTSTQQIEALVERLDDEGLNAIAEAIKSAGWIKVQSEESLQDAAKN